jgi:hypothetical protein
MAGDLEEFMKIIPETVRNQIEKQIYIGTIESSAISRFLEPK